MKNKPQRHKETNDFRVSNEFQQRNTLNNNCSFFSTAKNVFIIEIFVSFCVV